MDFSSAYTIADRQTREKIISELMSHYAFLCREIIGESRCSRPIEALSIGNTDKQVLFCGAFHGMEWITSLILLRFLDDIANTIKNSESICGVRIGTFLNKRGLTVIPCINPDGVEIAVHGSSAAENYQELVRSVSGGDTAHWQANAAGVDINHNFSAGWDELKCLELRHGICSPAPTRYGGEFPESEPETRTLASYCRTGQICHALAFHSQGEEIYWDFDDYHDSEALTMAKIMAHSSGYTVSQPNGLAVGGGFKDWFVRKFRRPAFTIEVGKGVNPLPIAQFDNIYNKIREMLVLAAVL
ncbi:MAG: M14 family metallocarboxypeptidase [Acutalibacteraceae bacterium]